MTRNIFNINIKFNALKRIIAFILTFIILINNTNLFGGLMLESIEDDYSNTIGNSGFTVEAFWKDINSLDYVWNATKPESRSPRLVLMYSNPSIQQAIYKGDIQFIVPCFGDVLRDDPPDPLHNIDTEWTGNYNKEANQYTYTYDGEAQSGGHLSGGFELVWNLQSRVCENGYYKSDSVIAKIRKRDENGNILKDANGNEMWDTIKLPPLSFSFTSQRDNYVVDVKQDETIEFIDSSEYYENDTNYIWYDIQSTITRTEKNSRGLEMSSYYIEFTPKNLPEGTDTSIYIRYGDSYYTLASLYDSTTGIYRFYPPDYQNMLGDFDEKNLTINFGIPHDANLDGVTFDITGHLNRLYKDDDDWVSDTIDEKPQEIDKVQDSSTISIISSTKDDYEEEIVIGASGDITASHSKSNPYSNENNRLNYLELFNSKIINFTLTGNVSGSKNYSLVMGDDLLIIQTQDGKYRQLNRNEYEIVGITMPKYRKYNFADTTGNNFTYYDYTITDESNTTYSGNTYQDENFSCSCKSIKIQIDGITGNINYKPIVKIKFLLNENSDFSQTGQIVNFSYLSVTNIDNKKLTLSSNPAISDYFTADGTNIVQYFDDIHHTDGTPYTRTESPVWLREPQVSMTSSTKFPKFDDNLSSDSENTKKSNTFTSTITTGGTITADVDTNLTEFSLYTVIPSSLDFDINDENIEVSGKYFRASDGSDGKPMSDFNGRVVFSTRKYDNNNTLIVADFYFNNEPVIVSPNQYVNISVSYPISLSYPTYIESLNNTYTVTSYTMLHDSVTRLSANSTEPFGIDIDNDGTLNEIVARSYASRSVEKGAESWEEYAPKYVKSSYSNGYVKETHVKIYDKNENTTSQSLSLYSYRLDFQMGNNNARELIFYDDIEQAEGTEWQGVFQDIDISPNCSNFESLGLNTTLYYSTKEDSTHDIYSNPSDWQPYESTTNNNNVKSIAVVVKPKNPDDFIMWSTYLYFTVNMKAPSDASYLNKTAINKFEVQYKPVDKNTLIEDENYKTVTSDETKVTLKKQTVKLTITKTDYNNLIKTYYKTDENGNQIIDYNHYSPITGATFAFFKIKESSSTENQEEQIEEEPSYSGTVNSRGVLVINDLQNGTYEVRETVTPKGYQTIESFTITVATDDVTLSNENENQMIEDAGGVRLVNISTVNGVSVYEYALEIPNERIPGKVELEKYCNNQFKGKTAVSDAKYELYNSNDELVFTNDNNEYDKNGNNSIFETDIYGKIKVTNLPWGSYYFLEKEAPDGYDLNPNKVNFTVDYTNVSKTEYIKVETEDSEKTTQVILVKKDKQDDTKLKGAQFKYQVLMKNENGEDYWYPQVKDENGNFTQEFQSLQPYITTSPGGQVIINNLPFGTYRFVEIQAPEGYETPTDDDMYSEEFILDAEHLSRTIYMLNEREKAQVQLKKDSEDGLLGGATYSLYKINGEIDTIIKPGEEGYPVEIDTDEDIRNYPAIVQLSNDKEEKDEYKGRVTTKNENTDTDLKGYTDIIKDLEWGNYYFIEEFSPMGYSYHHEPIEFTLNANNTNVPLLVTTTDERATGTVELKKVDKSNPTTLINGAIFQLHKNDGTLVSVYNNKGDKVTELITGSNFIYDINPPETETSTTENDESSEVENKNKGIIQVKNLEWGAYYFEEVQAPDGYGLNPDKVRFSVDNTNSQSVQKLVCEDPQLTAQLTIEKNIDARIDAYGSPTFIFQVDKLNDTDKTTVEKSWTKMITITSGLNGSVILAGLNSGTYRVSELPVSRYTLTSATAESPLTDLDNDNDTVTIKLDLNAKGKVTFTNTLERYDKYSHCSSAINVVATGKKLTSISAKLNTPIISLPAKNPTYTLTNNDIEVYAVYDDGSKELLTMCTEETPNENEYTISQKEFTATDIIQYKKINLSYTEGGISVSTMVILQVDALSTPKPITVDFHANYGYFGTEDDPTPIYRVQFTYDTDTETMQPDKDTNLIPKHVNDTYSFMGWYYNENPTEQDTQVDTDTLFENIKNGTETSTTINLYAGWVPGNAYLLNGKDQNYDTDTNCLTGKFNALSISNGKTKGDILAIKQSLFVPEYVTVNELVNISTLEIPSSKMGTKDDMLNYCVSDEDTGVKTFPIFAWFKDDTIYWWSKDMTPSMGDNGNNIFNGMTSLQDISGIKNWDTSNVTKMQCMFNDCTKLSNISALENWNTFKVTRMNAMFQKCNVLTSISALENWTTSSVQYMQNMFQNCTALTSISALENWTTSKVENMSNMFNSCSALTSISALENWNTSKVTNMSHMFTSCSNITSFAPIKDWAVSSVNNWSGFASGSTIKNGNVSRTAIDDFNTNGGFSKLPGTISTSNGNYYPSS
ncbi:MAG: SpaA isopeptide-forming pilin-related protein [Oscillospiraceae bacterium]